MPVLENITPRRRGLLAAQTLLSATLLWFVFRGFNWKAFLALMELIPWWLYCAVILIFLLGQLIYALKWHLLNRMMAIELPYSGSLELVMIGLFFNNFLPTSVGGDAARVYYLGKSAGYTRAGASVLLDRIVALGALVFLAMLSSWLVPNSFNNYTDILTVLSVLALSFTVLLISFVLVPPSLLITIVSQLPARFIGIGEELQTFRARLRKAPWVPLLIVILISTYYLNLAFVYNAYFAVTGQAGPPIQATLASVIAIAILSNIPVALNGIGLREQLHSLFFVALGISKEVAVGGSLLMFSGLLSVSIIGSLFWLRRSRLP
jgi:uncharacterized protein (TIRG00374 family)